MKRNGKKLWAEENFLVWFSGLSMAATPGKIGELIKPYFLQKLYLIPAEKSTPIVVLERFTDVMGLLLLSCLGMIHLLGTIKTIAVILSFVTAITVVMKSQRIHHILLKCVDQMPFTRKFRNKLEEFLNDSKASFSGINLLTGSVLSILSWGFEVVALYIAAALLDVRLDMTVAAFALAFSYLAGAISMVPGGVGITEGSMAGILLSSGIDRSIATVLTIVMRFCTLWFAVGLGTFAMIILTRGKYKTLSLNLAEEKSCG